MMIFTRIDIIWIGEIILGLRTIEEMITIMAEMSIGVMTVMIQGEMSCNGRNNYD